MQTSLTPFSPPRAQTRSTMSFSDFEGKKLVMTPVDGFMKCLSCCWGCGTPWTGKVTVDGDTAYMTDFTWCFCFKASPCPCTSCCCCDGPCVQHQTFKKVSDTKYQADGTSSVWKGGCCVGPCNNKGDAIEVKDGKLWWHAGNNNVVPPCVKGKSDVAYMTAAGGGPPTANATMER